MQQLVGKEGLLQIFWDIEEYSEGHGRIIPPTDFQRLELKKSHDDYEDEEDDEEDDDDEQHPHGIPLRSGRITGWEERPDYPPNFNYSFHELDDDANTQEKLAKQSSSLSQEGSDGVKFGGYPYYCQSEGPSLLERRPCGNCNRNHLYSTETINIYMDWGGTAQVLYCPEKADRIEVQYLK